MASRQTRRPATTATGRPSDDHISITIATKAIDNDSHTIDRGSDTRDAPTYLCGRTAEFVFLNGNTVSLSAPGLQVLGGCHRLDDTYPTSNL